MIITTNSGQYKIGLYETSLGNEIRIFKMVYGGFSNPNRYSLSEVFSAKGWSVADAERWCRL